MDERDAERVVEAVEDARGVEFRAALYYRTTPDGVEYETLRMRPDVRERYDDGERAAISQDIVDDLALEDLTQEWQERLHGVGALRFTTRVFENATVVHVGGHGTGLYLSLDNDDAPVTQAILDAIDRHLD